MPENHHPTNHRSHKFYIPDKIKWMPQHTEILTSSSCQINRNQIAFSIYRLILNQTKIRLIPNQSANDKYNIIWVYLTRIGIKLPAVMGLNGGPIR